MGLPHGIGAEPGDGQRCRGTLVANSAAAGVADLYVSVYSSTLNAAGRYMYDDGAIADLITRAHNAGMRVFAAYGAPDWPSLGCSANSFPLQRMDEIASYNAANLAAKLDGVILDVEPPEPQTTSDFQALLDQYACLQRRNEGGLCPRYRYADGGVPSHSHTLETASAPNAASFSATATILPDPSGAWQYDDNTAALSKQRFYRLRFP